MTFAVKKIENCFQNTQSYEYALPIDGEALVAALSGWEVRINHKLRRPVAVIQKDGIIIKCTLAGNVFRVSYSDAHWQIEKAKFEEFLENLP